MRHNLLPFLGRVVNNDDPTIRTEPSRNALQRLHERYLEENNNLGMRVHTSRIRALQDLKHVYTGRERLRIFRIVETHIVEFLHHVVETRVIKLGRDAIAEVDAGSQVAELTPGIYLRGDDQLSTSYRVVVMS